MYIFIAALFSLHILSQKQYWNKNSMEIRYVERVIFDSPKIHNSTKSSVVHKPCYSDGNLAIKPAPKWCCCNRAAFRFCLYTPTVTFVILMHLELVDYVMCSFAFKRLWKCRNIYSKLKLLLEHFFSHKPIIPKSIYNKLKRVNAHVWSPS